ncbi:MAG TPA: MFS transporter [Chloroflexota bacterium]|nr:MFS transporter [Chloroflexota bacterium]
MWRARPGGEARRPSWWGRGARGLLAEPAPLAAIGERADYRWWVVGTVCVGAALGQLNASIAGLVLPTLETVFDAPMVAVGWVDIAYLLTLTSLVVPFGRLADLIGRKLLYCVGFLVFLLGSVLCAVAPALGWLIAFRVLQAVGAALLQANSVALIAAAARPGELGRAVGVQGAAQAIGLAIGPSLGGLLIGLVGWRGVFFAAVPVGLLGAVLGWLVLPQTRQAGQTGQAPPVRRARQAAELAAELGPLQPAGDLPAGRRGRREGFDWLGALLFGPAVAAVMVAISHGGTWGWTSPRLLATLGGAVTLLVAFLFVERRVGTPLIDVALFRRRGFGTGIVAGLLSYTVLFGALFLIPLELQRVRGASPDEAGLWLSPVPVAIGLLAPISGLLGDRVGSRLPTVAGMGCAAMALVLLAAVPEAPPPVLLGGLALFGLGLGLFTPPNNSAVMADAPARRLGVASGILNMTRSAGTSLGVAATGAVLGLRLAAGAGGHVEGTANVDPALLVPAFSETLRFLAALAVLAGAVSMLRGTPQRVTSHGRR